MYYCILFMYRGLSALGTLGSPYALVIVGALPNVRRAGVVVPWGSHTLPEGGGTSSFRAGPWGEGPGAILLGPGACLLLLPAHQLLLFSLLLILF